MLPRKISDYTFKLLLLFFDGVGFCIKTLYCDETYLNLFRFCGVGSKFCVADANGYLKQFNWSDGLLVKNQSKPLSTIPFAYDLHPSRGWKIN